MLDVTERTIYLLGWPDPDRVMEPGSAVSAGSPGVPSAVASVAVDGIAAGTGGVGTPSTVASAGASGVASTAAVGTVQLNLQVSPTEGIPSTLAFGTTTAFISMNPASIAGSVGVGEPRVSFDMNPDGIASSVSFGDTDILATVFVIPGPVDPSNDFGDTRVIQKRLIFRPPTQTLGWGWYKRFEGVSLIKKDGVWSEVPWPTNQDTLEADVYLAGGRDHAVSTSLAAELISEGYSISEEY